MSTHDYVIQALGYNQRNSERIRNGEFRTKGLFVSSAVVEAGSKNFIGARLKKGVMHWSVKGANEVAALRSCVKSHRFDDY